MPNTLFPVFPSGSKYINSEIAVKTIGENVYYFNGEMAFYFPIRIIIKVFALSPAKWWS